MVAGLGAVAGRVWYIVIWMFILAAGPFGFVLALAMTLGSVIGAAMTLVRSNSVTFNDIALSSIGVLVAFLMNVRT